MRESSVPYGEVDALSTLLGYQTANAGCCKVSSHPCGASWKTVAIDSTISCVSREKNNSSMLLTFHFHASREMQHTCMSPIGVFCVCLVYA